MNSSPMIFRLASGSVTPARAPKNRSAAFTWTRSTWNSPRKVSSTWAPSLARIRPVWQGEAGELVADGLVHQGRGHRRVDAARQGAQHRRGRPPGPAPRRPGPR